MDGRGERADLQVKVLNEGIVTVPVRQRDEIVSVKQYLGECFFVRTPRTPAPPGSARARGPSYQPSKRSCGERCSCRNVTRPTSSSFTVASCCPTLP